tara:strand:+ start:1664 stop:2482 length:819 start_codon:yes stop_codon:yes gene_type:complete
VESASPYLLTVVGQAQYRARVIPQLADDVELSEQRLYESLNFYRNFPNPRTHGDLTWSQITRLLGVPDPDAREYYVSTVQAEAWSFRQLTDAIRTQAHRKTETVSKTSALKPLRGDLNVYRVRRPASAHTSRLYLDLGFSLYWQARDRADFQDGSIVQVRAQSKSSFAIRQVDVTPRRLFTHRLNVARVIDGDTLAVTLTTPNGDLLAQKLHLRGIATAELPTEAVHRAKRFVERYLADIFYLPGESDADIVAGEGRFLNGELLSEGLARRV